MEFRTVVSLEMHLPMPALDTVVLFQVHLEPMVVLITEDMEDQEEVNHSEVGAQVLVAEAADFLTEDLEVLGETRHLGVGIHLDLTEDPEVLEATHHPEVETHLEARMVVPADTFHRVTLEVEVDLHLAVDSQVPLE